MRQMHQDLEVHAEAIGDELVKETNTVHQGIARYQKIKARIDSMQATSRKLQAAYKDDDGVLAGELRDISGDNSLEAFQQRLDELRRFHQRFPAAPVVIDRSSTDVKVPSQWSYEEARGRFLDLHEVFNLYINLPHFKRCDYLTFLNTFEEQMASVRKEDKIRSDQAQAYREFLSVLYNYLKSFFIRTNPLVNVAKIEALIEEHFQRRWEAKSIQGWFEEEDSSSQSALSNGSALKKQKTANGTSIPSDPLFCEACQKNFTKQTTFDAHLSGKKHKKALKKSHEPGENSEGGLPGKTLQVKQELLCKVMALLEEKILHYLEFSRNNLNETKVHAELRQTRTREEIEADLEEEHALAEDSDSEEEERKETIYNPLNLPLGWDGKPIPLWLYKLHGLNIPYPCEICGNHTYFGPRAFERHFNEWRHVYGLKCLGIENSKHFMHITKIMDAEALHAKLSKTLSSSSFKPEEEEEFEDKDGNVFNKKTYEDLRRQGLI